MMPAHAHLFLNCPPNLAPDQIIFRIKGRTSRVLRQEFPILHRMPNTWTRSYFLSTAGNVSSETIKRYIAEQKTLCRPSSRRLEPWTFWRGSVTGKGRVMK